MSQKIAGSTATVDPVGTTPPKCPPDVKYPLLVHLLRTKHRVTKGASDDVIEILNELSRDCLGKKILPKDARTVEMMYSSYLPTSEKHFFCKKCGAYVGKQKKREDKYFCSNCQSSSSFSDSEYVYYLPLADQLKQLFETNYEEVSIALEKDPRAGRSRLITSTKGGWRYCEFRKGIPDQEDHISLSFSCDGVPVFASSKSSLWPVLCTINELPMTIRKRHVLLAGLWYGVNKKPEMNQFLYPFVKELIKLRHEGFTYYRAGEKKTCKATALKNISDSVARPTLLGSHQYNGEYGCTDCYHTGLQIPKGKGTVRVYRHLDGVARRSSEETNQFAKAATALKKKPFHVMGIKGETILSYVPGFDIIDGLIVDYMHACILGTMRQFAKLWFNSKYHEKEFYLGHAKEEVNKRLKLLKPPFYFSRPPRSLEEMKFWKGHEFYLWGLIYSPAVLKGILPTKFLRHWLLFIEALFLLTQESIAKSQVYNAMDLMVQFTKGTEELYGLEHCSFNIHLGEHLGDAVLRWGNLFEHSAFLYEDYNQVILKAVHSCKGVLDQVVNQIRTERSIPSVLITPAGSSVNHLNVASKERLLSTQNSVSCSNDDSNALVFSPNVEEIPGETRLALASINVSVKPKTLLCFANRILVN